MLNFMPIAPVGCLRVTWTVSPIVVQASIYSDSHMAHAVPPVLLSLEDIEVEVMDKGRLQMHRLLEPRLRSD